NCNSSGTHGKISRETLLPTHDSFRYSIHFMLMKSWKMENLIENLQNPNQHELSQLSVFDSLNANFHVIYNRNIRAFVFCCCKFDRVALKRKYIFISFALTCSDIDL